MIPSDFHIVYLTPDSDNGKAFGYAHYLCIFSIIKAHPDSKVNFYYNKPIVGMWYELLKPLIEEHLVLAPTEIFGQRIKKVEHQADILRLNLLIEKGGTYVDSDVFFTKSLVDLMSNNLVMGIENGIGLCNAVIMAEQNSPFIIEWLQSYHPDCTHEGAGFDPNGWGEMSVKFPEYLSTGYEDYMTILDSSAFYQPSGSPRGLEILFDSLEYTCDTSYANHLWASQAWDGYLKDLTPEKVLNKSGYFYKLVRYTLTKNEIFGTIYAKEIN